MILDAATNLVIPAWTRRVITDDWTRHGPVLTASDRLLLESREMASRLRIRELRDGLEIETYSYVGVLPLQGFTLHIPPRIAPEDLVRMVDYCFDTGGIQIMDEAGPVQASLDATCDLLICAFLLEMQRLLAVGLLREYVEQQDDLSTVRGKIQFRQLALRPRPSITLPCRYEDRSANIHLNRLLLAVVGIAGQCASSSRLKRGVRRAEEQLKQLCTSTTLTGDSFRHAIVGLTRLTAGYRKALELGWLLYDSITPDQDMPDAREFPGFLLDMNHLFERFIGRLLDEFRPPGTSIVSQRSIPYLYRTCEGRFKHPRPDFMLLDEPFGLSSWLTCGLYSTGRIA